MERRTEVLMGKLRRAGLIALALAICAALGGCGAKPPEAVQVLLDGAAWDGKPVDPEGQGLRVYITLDGKPLIDLPFDQARVVTLRQPGLGENTVTFTGTAVYMSHADCENQDCVNMGAVTADNLELRVMGGFIVCLPHRLSIEVRGD